MKRVRLLLSATFWAAFGLSPALHAKPASGFVIPQSSIAHPQDRGVRAHTNLSFRVIGRDGVGTQNSVGGGSPANDPYDDNPASLACIYGLTPHEHGCISTQVRAIPAAGSRVIAIVDAYDYPTAQADLTFYSRVFRLPAITAANFQVVSAIDRTPRTDPTGGWEVEEALDIEIAHGLAPNAKIILVEAKSDLIADLAHAVDVAAQLVQQAGGGEVSMSWGGEEFPQEVRLGRHFNVPGVVFLAASGDSSGTIWPSVAPNVIAVGGTGVQRRSNLQFLNQIAGNFGSGPSTFETRPSYQDGIEKIVGGARGVPDVAFYFCEVGDMDCGGGFLIYDTTFIYRSGVVGWIAAAGTSVGTPAMAAILNDAGQFADSSAAELMQIYSDTKSQRDFTDIVMGGCFVNNTYTYAVRRWDFCTGVGTPFGLGGK